MENKTRAAVTFQTHITSSRVSTCRLVSHGASKLHLCFLLHFRQVGHGIADSAAITEQGCGCTAAQIVLPTFLGESLQVATRLCKARVQNCSVHHPLVFIFSFHGKVK